MLTAESRINTGFFESTLGNYEILYECVTWIWRWGIGNRISIFFEKFINIFKVTVCAGSVPGMVSGISVFQVNFKIGGKKL